MVDGINGKKQFVKIDNTNQKIDLTKLDGIRIGDKNSIFLKNCGFDVNGDGRIQANELFDQNGDGVISGKNETDLLAKYLLDVGGSDQKIGKNDFNLGGPANAAKFEALKHIATQQEVRINGGTYEDTTAGGGKFQLHCKEDGSSTLTVETKKNNKPITTVSKYDPDGRLLNVTSSSADTVTTTTYSAWDNVSGKPAKGEIVRTDAKGNIKSKSSIEVTYNDQGQVTSQKVVTKDAKGNVIQTETKVLNYDENGRHVSTSIVKEKPATKSSPATKTETEIKLNEDGKTSSMSKTTTKMIDGKPVTSSVNTTFEYNDKGKISVQKDVTTNDKGEVTNAVTTFTYGANGKKESVSTIRTDAQGQFKSEQVSRYAEDGKTLIGATRLYEKNGEWFQESYSAANIENRIGRLPDTCIKINNPTDRTPIETTVNQFDDDGVLIGRYRTDVNGQEISGSRHDFAKPDGKIGVSYQAGMGDCYLLAAINSLAVSEAGQAALSENIEINQGPPVTYTVKLPGVKIARNNLIKGGENVPDLIDRDGNSIDKLPADKVFIQESYTFTQEEFDAACKKAGGSYSIGDKDVLLLEMAYEKFRQDSEKTLDANNLDRTKGQNLVNLDYNASDKDPDLAGGNAGRATFFLTGKQSVSVTLSAQKDAPICYIDNDMQMQVGDDDMKERFKHLFDFVSDNFPLAANNNSTGTDPAKEEKFDDMLNVLKADYEADGKFDHFSATVGFVIAPTDKMGSNPDGGGHAISIKGFDDKGNIILSNPWNPEQDVVMSIADFKRAATRVNLTPLTQEGVRAWNMAAADNQNVGGAGNAGGSGGAGNVNGGGAGAGAAQNPTQVQAQLNTLTGVGVPQGGFTAGEIKAGEKYTVRKGTSISKMVTAMLIEQGIPATKENIKKARAIFEQQNASLIKTSRKGVKFVLIGAKVMVPTFNKAQFK